MLSTHPQLVWSNCVQYQFVRVLMTIWSTFYSFDLVRIDFSQGQFWYWHSNTCECLTLTIIHWKFKASHAHDGQRSINGTSLYTRESIHRFKYTLHNTKHDTLPFPSRELPAHKQVMRSIMSPVAFPASCADRIVGACHQSNSLEAWKWPS